MKAIPKTCAGCGNAATGRSRYCSRACGRAALDTAIGAGQRDVREPVRKTCIGCRRVFLAPRKPNRYCTIACARKFQPPRGEFDPAVLVASNDEYTRALISIVTEPRAGAPMTRVRVDAVDILLAICLEEVCA